MKKRNMLRSAAILLAVLIFMIVASGCNESNPEFLERSGFYFDTYIDVKLWSENEVQQQMDNAFELCAYYDGLFDAHSPDSEIARINDADGAPCEVSEDTAALLELGREYSELSDGRFDLTCGRVTALWNFASDEPTLPDCDALAQAIATVGSGNMQIDGHMVTLSGGAQLDAGGIAKGYIADRLAEQLRSRSVTRAIIDLGGNIVVIGSKDGEPFTVGIQSPFDSSAYIGILRVSDCSVVTAGTYQRFFTLDGVRYHHIIDLSTGMPARTRLAAITVIAQSSAQADALATICFLLGADEGKTLIESIGVSAVFVTEDGETILAGDAGALYKAL